MATARQIPLGDESFRQTTCFAPSDRADREDIERSIQAITRHPIIQGIVEVVDCHVVVLNRQRQILFANEEMRRDFGLACTEDARGLRPGEAMNCAHASAGPGGCGTSRHCSSCGAVLAILQSQELGRPVVSECRMIVDRTSHTETREFRVKAAPLAIEGETLMLVSFRDISEEKRRETLEQVFFHDILNTVSGLDAWTRLFSTAEGEKREAGARRIRFLGERLRREITDQRSLLEAERGTLEINLMATSVRAILETVEELFSVHGSSRGRSLVVDPPSGDDRIITDPSLVIRVLTNMVKNALEAIPKDGTVRVTSRGEDGSHEFHVWNAGAIPGPVAEQIFRRSFSTKGHKGRGLGTFSMKLFGERYLGGRVAFTTSEKDGTVFSITLPRNGPERAPGSPGQGRA